MILGLDLATNIGVCHGDGHSIPELAHHRLPSTGDEVGPFLSAFRKWFTDLLERVAPTVIAFEAPILPRAKFDRRTGVFTDAPIGLSTSRKLQGLAGVLEMVCFDEGVPCFEAQPAAVKKALTGQGRASKAEMVHWARRYGLEPHTYTLKGEEASDEADAFGVWLAVLRARFPAVAPMWEPLIAARVAA